jgi:DNA-binding MarR family transcriptional regulator
VPASPCPDDEQIVGWWGLLVEGFAATSRLLADDIARSGLPATWFEVLLRLRRTPGHRLSASHLAAEVSFSSGGFTKLTDRIVTAGLVERHPCQDDRRVTWIGLTPQGLALIDAATRNHARQLREHVLGVLGTDGFAALADASRALRDHARTLDGAEPADGRRVDGPAPVG